MSGCLFLRRRAQFHVVRAGDGALSAPQQILLQIIHLAPSAVPNEKLQLLKLKIYDFVTCSNVDSKQPERHKIFDVAFYIRLPISNIFKLSLYA